MEKVICSSLTLAFIIDTDISPSRQQTCLPPSAAAFRLTREVEAAPSDPVVAAVGEEHLSH